MAARSHQFKSGAVASIGMPATGPAKLFPNAKAASDGDFVAHRFLHNVAYHEAGHATTSRLLGLPVAGCTVNCTNGHHGLTWATNDDGGKPARSVADVCGELAAQIPGIGIPDDIAFELQRAGDQVISLLAGPIAEELFFGTRLSGSEHDDAEARAFASLIVRTPAAVDSYLGFAKAEAAGLFVDRAQVVCAVASALVSRRTLDRRCAAMGAP